MDLPLFLSDINKVTMLLFSKYDTDKSDELDSKELLKFLTDVAT